MKLRLLILLVVAPAAWAEVKIEEQIVGPANTGGAYVVAPRGAHVAYVGMKGTRMTVTVNGVEGPVFDEFYGPTGSSFFCPPQTGVYRGNSGGMQGQNWPVIFSDDGAHYAYAGRQGQEYVVIHDGKEIARGPREALALNYGPLTISPKGRHVYWDEMKKEGATGTWRLMMSGRPGPWSGHQTMSPVFSSDESRYAYNAGKVGNYQEQMLIVDGKDAGYAGMQPVFTADGKLLLSIAPTTAASPKPALLVNGKPVVTGIQISKIVPGPVGSQYAAIVRTKVDPTSHMGVDTLFMDGKEVPGTDGAQTVWFSADGKHYAAACVNAAARSMFMVVDGKRQTEYQSVSTDKVYWTPDGSRFIYTVTSAGRTFLIVNGEETAVTSLIGNNPIALPEVGSRYGYATRDGANRNFTVVIDGKSVLPAGVYPYDNTLTFSADGSRYAYFVGPVGRSELTGLVLDGVIQPNLTPGYFGRWITSDVLYTSVVFSRDGKHVAYLGRNAEPNSMGLYVDGKLVYPSTRAIYFPTFTADSQHLFWAADEPSQVRGQPPSIVVYVDGQRAVTANGYFFKENPPSSIDSDGVLTFLAAAGDVVKRYRITPAPGLTVTKFVNDAEANRAKALAEAQAAQQQATEAAAAAKAKAAEEAAAAKAKAQADYAAAVATKTKARQDALDAKRLYQLNAQRAKQGLPPLTELPLTP